MHEPATGVKPKGASQLVHAVGSADIVQEDPD
jgi:hypothetical protein